MVKAWDLKEFACIQTISVRFPSTLGGKTPSFGQFATDLYLNTSTVHPETSLPGGLVLACNDYLCLMKLGQDTARDGSLTETHSSPISCAVFNSRLKQVNTNSFLSSTTNVLSLSSQLITCGNNSSIGAWEIDTGRRVFFILDAHDGEEITSIAIDRPCRKIATGSRNGVVKVTSFSSSLSPSTSFVCPDLEQCQRTEPSRSAQCGRRGDHRTALLGQRRDHGGMVEKDHQVSGYHLGSERTTSSFLHCQ